MTVTQYFSLSKICHIDLLYGITPPDTAVLSPARQAGTQLNLPTPEGWKVELTLVVG